MPATRRQRARRFPRRPRRTARARLSGCSASPRDAFDGARSRALVRERLAAASTTVGRRRSACSACRSPCTAATTGALVWSGSDVVFGDVTRANPNFRLFDESLVTRVLTTNGASPASRSRTAATGEHPGRQRAVRRRCGAMHCARRSCCGPSASGRRPSAACSTTSRRSSTPPDCATSRPRRTADEAAGAERAERGDLGAVHRRRAVPRADHAARCVADPSRR